MEIISLVRRIYNRVMIDDIIELKVYKLKTNTNKHMAKNKGSRIVVTLECARENSKDEVGRTKGVFRYTTQKNRRNTPGRIELKKFCPHSNCHKLFKEIK